MMEKNETIFDFIGNVFMLFGITVLMLMGISMALGMELAANSVMFPLGDEGLSMALLIQFFMVSVMIMAFRFLFMTDLIIKEASNAMRTFWMLLVILVGMCVFIFIFNWFPTGNLMSWVLFFSFFMISFMVSALIVFWKEKFENRQMEEGLERMKARYKEYEHENKYRN